MEEVTLVVAEVQRTETWFPLVDTTSQAESVCLPATEKLRLPLCHPR